MTVLISAIPLKKWNEKSFILGSNFIKFNNYAQVRHQNNVSVFYEHRIFQMNSLQWVIKGLRKNKTKKIMYKNEDNNDFDRYRKFRQRQYGPFVGQYILDLPHILDNGIQTQKTLSWAFLTNIKHWQRITSSTENIMKILNKNRENKGNKHENQRVTWSFEKCCHVQISFTAHFHFIFIFKKKMSQGRREKKKRRKKR